jgi:tyrosine-protein kinase Etk/Wzc
MNNPHSPDTRAQLPASPEPASRATLSSPKADEFDLGELLANLWDGRYLILGVTAFMLFLGAFHAWRSTPIYEAEALLQIDTQRPNSANEVAFARMESLFAEPAEAKTEIEIISSNLVLGRTIETLGLDIECHPVLLPLIGRALHRGRATAPAIEVESFEIPETLRRQAFQVKAAENGAYQLLGPDGSNLGTGRAGETLASTFAGQPLKLRVKRIQGKPGQAFSLVRQPLLKSLADLRAALFVVERGKTPNTPATLLGLSYEHPDPVIAAQVLNEILNQYLRQAIERKSTQTAKTMAILQEQLPVLKAKLDESESRLNQFRSRSGSVDLSREADITLQQSSSLGAQISSLRQRREELLRTYRENSDVVATLDQQIRKLEGEVGQVETKVRALPRTQQEVVRLSRDVQVNQELYTALLNNLQQLRITMAGDVGKARIVDPAYPPLEAVKPRKGMVIVAFAFMGLFIGLALTGVRRLLQRGLEDHRLIETKLGLPVFVTIPHSRAQEAHYLAMDRRIEGSHLLAVGNPDDLATESLRSLRVMLQFTMKEAKNGVIMVAGPSPSIGKSFVASNLATVLAQAGSRVLLVDGDLRRGSLHHYFGLKNRMGGLSEVLSGRAAWSSSVRKTEIENLEIMSSGILAPDPSELLSSPRFSEFIDEASKAYDFVIIDAPPLLSVTDATIIGTKVGTVLLVTKYGQNSLDEIHTCQMRFEKVGVTIKGCIVNGVKARGMGYKGSDYRYAYHYKYTAQ